MVNEELAVLIQHGEKKYILQLWEQTERLIKSIILKKYKSKTLPYGYTIDDLLQCAYFVLLAAIKYYDSTKDLKFNSYLDRCVMHVINTELRKAGSKADLSALSLDTPISDKDETLTLFDTIEDEGATERFSSVEDDELITIVRTAVNALPDDERQVIICYYFRGLTLSQTAEKLNTDTSRIVYVKNKALAHLRRDNQLRKYYYEYSGVDPTSKYYTQIDYDNWLKYSFKKYL